MAPSSRLCADTELLAIGDPADEDGLSIADRAIACARLDCAVKTVIAKRALGIDCPPKPKQRRAKEVAAVLVEKKVKVVADL